LKRSKHGAVTAFDGSSLV